MWHTLASSSCPPPFVTVCHHMTFAVIINSGVKSHSIPPSFRSWLQSFIHWDVTWLNDKVQVQLMKYRILNITWPDKIRNPGWHSTCIVIELFCLSADYIINEINNISRIVQGISGDWEIIEMKRALSSVRADALVNQISIVQINMQNFPLSEIPLLLNN